MFNFFKSIFAPKKCYRCLKYWNYLCDKCLEEIHFYESLCYTCKQKTHNFKIHFYCENNHIFYNWIFVLFHYKEFFIKKMIKNFKFYKKFDLWEFFWKLLWELLLNNIEKTDILLIPTPMYWFKKLKRWYNQSEILVENISKIYSIPSEFNLIKKIKYTKPQSHLSKMQRIDNLTNCYKIDENLLKIHKNKTIIIVDDVVSTGTTINEMSKILKKNWFKNIYWLVIASD